MSDAADLKTIVERLRSKIGTRGKSKQHKVEPGALIKFARATGQTHPHYLDEQHGPIASPTWLSRYCADACEGLIELDIGLPMFLHSDDVARLGAPIRGGDVITASSHLADVFIKKGKRGAMLFQTVEMELTNQHKAHVATVRVSAVSF